MVTLIAFHLACFRLAGSSRDGQKEKQALKEKVLGGGGVNCARFVFCLLVLAAVPLSG